MQIAEDSTRASNGVFQHPDKPLKRARMEETDDPENVISSTTPKIPLQRVNSDLAKGNEVVVDANRSKAVKEKFKDPVTGEEKLASIAYDRRGMPIFDDIAKYPTQIDKTKPYDGQMRQATHDLRDAIKAGKVSPSAFIEIQMAAIPGGKEKYRDLHDNIMFKVVRTVCNYCQLKYTSPSAILAKVHLVQENDHEKN